MSLYRRDGSSHWWIRFKVRGRRVRQSSGTSSRAQAEEFETALRSQYWREFKLGESFCSWHDAAERWKRETAHKRTAYKDAQIIRWFDETPEFRELPLRAITREVIDAAREKLSEGLRPTTVNHYMALLRAVLRRAQLEWGWLESVPRVPMYPIRHPDPRFITRARFIKLVRELPPHTADIASLAVYTGLRKANITGLTWDRVDLKRATAFVPGSQAKGGRGINVPLNREAVALLKRWKGKHESHVFGYRGKPITQVSTKAWRAATKRAGLAGLRFHDLRHTWASWQVQAETPLSALQELGGWASFQMVRRYAHLAPGHLKRYADRTLLGTKRATVLARDRIASAK
jgi:integrase